MLWVIKIAVVLVTVMALLVALLLHQDSHRTAKAAAPALAALSSTQEALGDREDRLALARLRASRSRPVTTPKVHQVVVAQPVIHHKKKFAATRQYEGSTLSGGWARLRACESGGDYQQHNSPPYYGAYQFNQSTWDATARRHGPEWVGVRPDHAPPAVQDRFAVALQAERGWSPWPVC